MKILETKDIILRVFFFVIFVFIYPVFSNGATLNRDSLFAIIHSSQHTGDELIEVYTLLAKEYNKFDPDSAGYFAAKGLELSRRYNNRVAELSNLVTLGSVEVQRDSLVKANKIYLEAMALADEGSDPHSVLSVYIMLGYINDLLDNYDKALDYYFKGLSMADSLGMKEFSSRFNNNIGTIFSAAKKYKKAITYYLRAAKLFKETGELDFYANALLNTGGDYYKLGNDDSTLFYLEKSREINEKLENHYGLLNYYLKTGQMEYDKGNYEEALERSKLQMKELEELDKSFFGSNAYNKAGALLFQGEVYYHIGDYNKAVELFHKALNTASLSEFNMYVAMAHEWLSKVYEAKGDTGKALQHYKLFVSYNDSVKMEESLRKIAELEMSYKLNDEIRKIQTEKERLEYSNKIRNLVYLSIAGSVTTALLIFISLYVNQRNKHKLTLLKEKNLKIEKETLRKELELKNKELTTNVMYLLKKNEFISDISKRLKVTYSGKEGFNPDDVITIIKDLDKNTSNEVWKEFEKRFKDIYGDFYKNLNTKFPGLTPNDLKLAAFLKLNMTTKEISAITFQSPETLKTARYRLRKKLGLSREDNLTAFLNQI